MKLIFVYNAKSGTRNAILDAGHKLFSPSTYQCSLCALTHNTFSETKQWKEFRTKTTVEMVFFHSDEFEATFSKTTYSYPIVLSEKDSKFKIFMTSEELDETETLEQLINTISNKLTL